MSAKPKEERWNILFSQLIELSAFHSELKKEIRIANNILKANISRLDDYEKRLITAESQGKNR